MMTDDMNYHERGLELAEAGRHQEAIEYIRQHLRNCPDDAQALNDAGAILHCLGQSEESLSHFIKAKTLLNDSGEIVGLDGIDTSVGLDNLRTRIEGVSSNSINPSLPVRVRSIKINELDIAVIEIPKGPEPVYYTRNGVPYIRHGSMSRPALPQEVNELIKRHLERTAAN